MQKRLLLSGFAVLLSLILLAVPLAAQTDGAIELTPGSEVTGTLDSTNFATSYVFTGSVGDAVTIDAVTGDTDLSLVLLLVAPDGVLVAADNDLFTPNEATIADFSLPLDGQYTLIVMRGSGAAGIEGGEFSLVLSGQLTPPTAPAASNLPTATLVPIGPPTDGGSATLTGGINIELAWTNAVNMDIEVRDPRGSTVYSE
ncbi:MAG TPA: hypothetical protein VJZ27_03065, partial [Aggregatilineales bacterium]|nr:hypothetical protein [Aggregatilineales bacterium]